MRIKLPTALLGAALLAAGCDYWKNLTESKSVDRVKSLSFRVIDGWTRASLSARCADSSHALEAASEDGRFTFTDLPTGHYVLTCAADSNYYDGSLETDLLPRATGDFNVEMWRKGGSHWYPDTPGMKVAAYTEGSFRAPGKIVLRASPSDTAGRLFEYRWTKQRKPDLDGIPIKSSTLPLHINLSDTGEEVYHLTVMMTPPGREPYPVGNSDLPLTFATHRPHLEVDTSDGIRTYKVGCGDVPVTMFVNFKSWSDSGFNCDSTVITSLNPNGAMGDVHQNMACTEEGVTVGFTLTNKSAPSQRRTDRFRVAVHDGDLFKADTLSFITVTNVKPNVTHLTALKPVSAITRWPVFFNLVVTDEDSPIEGYTIFWGDGRVTHGYVSDADQDKIRTSGIQLPHAYEDTGLYSIRATAEDNCGAVADTKYGEPKAIDVHDNSPPTLLSVHYDVLPPDTIRIIVSATDRNNGDNADYLIESIDWGDPPSAWKDKQFPLGVDILNPPDTLKHSYAGYDSLNLRIGVRVRDAHGGQDEKYLDIPNPLKH